MSGGSYKYMCFKSDDELFSYEYIQELEKMVDRLTESGYEDVAREAEELLLTIKQSKVRCNTMHDRLSDVFKAVEWLDSGDYGMQTFEESIKEYRGE